MSKQTPISHMYLTLREAEIIIQALGEHLKVVSETADLQGYRTIRKLMEEVRDVKCRLYPPPPPIPDFGKGWLGTEAKYTAKGSATEDWRDADTVTVVYVRQPWSGQ